MSDFVTLLRDARRKVEASTLYARFISGTPLENDIAVWMVEFAQSVQREQEANTLRQRTESFAENLRHQAALAVQRSAEDESSGYHAKAAYWAGEANAQNLCATELEALLTVTNAVSSSD